MAIPTTVILSILSLLLLPSPSAAIEESYLLTGDVLPTDGQISYGGSVFVMQGDCNLVLYKKGGGGFQSNTHGRGTDCTLTLTDDGKLVIKKDKGINTVWSSRPGGNQKGKYAAVIGPDGHVNVYGPSIWSVPYFIRSTVGEAELNNIDQLRPNMLFSSQVLYGNSKLESRDYTLELTESCNLEFSKTSRVVWESNTKGNGQHCFLRLNHRGQLSVIDDANKVLWYSSTASTDGNYVLIVQANGQAVVYGPVVWSTATGNKGLIQMPAAEK